MSYEIIIRTVDGRELVAKNADQAAVAPMMPTEAVGIRCIRCGRTSWHPEDVRQRYCGFCHLFHEG